MNQDKFIEELAKINIFPTSLQLSQLNKYYQLLVEYNKIMNLTGITEKEDVYLKHFYDSLTISRVIDLTKNIKICDIGTGAGFPGLVLKIIYPNLSVVLVDCLNKRINFLNTVISELKLKNIETVHSRIEDYGKNHREIFDIVTARAVASVNVLLEYSIPLVKINGYFIPMKAKLDHEPDYKNALKELDCNIMKTDKFILPVENSERSILLIKKEKKTKNKYPRSNNEIKKKPL